jgi:hypothetical protein
MGGYQEDVVKRQRLLEHSHSKFLVSKNALYARAPAAFLARLAATQGGLMCAQATLVKRNKLQLF